MSEPLSTEWLSEKAHALLNDAFAAEGGVCAHLAAIAHLRSVAAEAMRWAAERVDATPGIKHQGAASAAILRRAEEIEKGGGE